MKITKLAQTRPLLSIGGVFGGGSGGSSGGPSGQVPIANGSNSVAWGSNVQVITSNGSNALLGPFVNFASGSNIFFTLDQGPFPQQSVPSNTLRIHSTAGGSGGGTASGYDLDTYSIDPTYGDDFTAASLSGSWTRRNYTSGAETYQVGKNATYIQIAKTGRTNGDGYMRTAPAGDWTFAMAFVAHYFGPSTSCAWGIGVMDTNGTGVATVGVYTSPVSPLLVSMTTYTGYGGTFVQPGGGTSAIWDPAQKMIEHKYWVYLRKSGTNYYTAYSLDGEAWSPESNALVWAGTVDRVAMMDAPLGTVSSGVNNGSYVTVDWFNKIA
jgi:hypothetical protein